MSWRAGCNQYPGRLLVEQAAIGAACFDPENLCARFAVRPPLVARTSGSEQPLEEGAVALQGLTKILGGDVVASRPA